MACAFAVVALLVLAAQSPQSPHSPPKNGDDMARRVAELLADLDDAALGKAAQMELIALGALAAPALAAQALDDQRSFARCLPVLRASAASARIALRAAVDTALAVPPDGEEPLPRFRVPGTGTRARELVAALAPYVKDAKTLCAPLLAEPAATDRLAVRCSFCRDTPVKNLTHALDPVRPLALEVALELLGSHDETAATHCGDALQSLWDARDNLEAALSDHVVEFREVEEHLARALLAILPRDARIGEAHATLLAHAQQPFETIACLQQIANLGPAAVPAIDDITRLCCARDDAVCRAAVDALARLGPVAEPARDQLEHCAEHAADLETRRLAKIAIRRITQPGDMASLASDLIDDLAHGTRGERAQRDLRRMGAPAAKALLAALGDPARRALWPYLIELLHTMPAKAEPELRALLATAPADFAHATWHRLRVVVDLAAGSPLDTFVEAQLQRWSRNDPERASRCEALLARLAGLRLLTDSGADTDLTVALSSAQPALVERAARVALRRGNAPPAVCAALVAAFLAEPAEITSNEDDLRLGADPQSAVARALLALDPSPPPAALDVALAADTPSERIARLRRLHEFPWPSDVKLARLLPHLGDDQIDEVRIAALDALSKSIARDHPTPSIVARVATIRWNRALARAAQRAVAR